MKKTLLFALPCMLLGLFAFSGCSEGKLSGFEAVTYDNVAACSDVDSYIAAVSDNGPDEDGVILSPYHSLRVNGVDVPVYGTRVSAGIHSFAWLDVTEEAVNLSIEITSHKKWSSVEVLPLSTGVTATTEDKVTKCSIKDTGSFSFGFNKKNEYGMTIYVAHKSEFALPEGYTQVTMEPGTYTAAQTTFSATNTAYYFKKGYYKLNYVFMPSDSVFYFEPGTYIEDYLTDAKDYKSLFAASGSNIRFCGRPLVDYSKHIGGPANTKQKGHFNFSGVTDFTFEGCVSIDASSWCLCFTNAKRIEVKECMLFGYKTCSDGIMLSDTQDSRVHHNFVRTGDDAVEAKSTGSQGSSNLLYEYNAVWADKARCYGCIWESAHDMDGIVFRHNSVGFSTPAWDDGLGCMIVIMGNTKTSTWQNITFEDMEIYSVVGKIANLTVEEDGANPRYGGNIKNVTFKDVRVYAPYAKHQELIWINIASTGTLGKVYVDNFQYVDVSKNMVKYTSSDVEDSYKTHIWTHSQWSHTNLVVA